MNTEKPNTICPRCGAAVPPDAPQGLCPKCVFAGAASGTEAGQAAPALGEAPSLERVAAAFPQLEILGLAGRGGMGFVFKARQVHLDRFVALKLLPDALASDPHFAERFNREGRVLARLNHPNIVSVYDFGQAGSFYFLLMEFVDGVNLRQAMRAGRFSPPEALAIVPPICEALQYAHEQGVLHRDIKPENILLDTQGRVKIADFGIAKLMGPGPSEITLTGTGATLGTPHYMAPEQLEKPSHVDHRADIYSLGVVFYEMLTGELPLGRFAPPSAKTPVDSRVDEVVFRTLEKEPERRFQSAGEVKTRVDDLRQAGASQATPSAAKPDPATATLLSGGAQPERVCHCSHRAAVSTVTHTWSWVGQSLPFLATGDLGLWSDRLEFVGRGFGRHIALRDLVGATVTSPPRRPWRRFQERLTVSFFDSGVERVLDFALVRGPLEARDSSAVSPAHWLTTLRRQAALINGTELPAAPVERAVAAVRPSPARQRLWPASWLALYGLALLLISMGTPRAWILAFAGMLVTLVSTRAVVLYRRAGLNLVRWPKKRMPPSAAPTTGSAAAAGLMGPQPEGIRRLSTKAVVAASLASVSLVLPLLLCLALLTHMGGIGPGELWLTIGLGLMPGVAATILGWVALGEIRESQGHLRGQPLALFAALVWPVFLLVSVLVVPPFLVLGRFRRMEPRPPLVALLALLLVPAGALTFAVWGVSSTGRWASGQRPWEKRGVLRWIFIALVLFGFGVFAARPRHAAWDADNQGDALAAAPNLLPEDQNTLLGIQADTIHFPFRIAQGQVATFEVHRLDRVPPESVRSFSAYVVASDVMPAQADFVLSPAPVPAAVSSALAWTMSLTAEGAGQVHGGPEDFGELISALPPGSNQVYEIPPGSSLEIPVTQAYREGADLNSSTARPVLTVVIHSSARRERVATPQISLTFGTNWVKALTDSADAENRSQSP